MTDELVDVVNENDEIIGKELKSTCHKKGLWHRVTAVLVLNYQNEIALQKRALNHVGGGELDHSAAGHVSLGEEYDLAALRELKEELGIKAKLTKISYQIMENWDDKDGRKLRHIYSLYVCHNNGPFSIQESEVESINFYSEDKIKEMMKNNPKLFSGGFRMNFKYYLEWRNKK